MGQDKRIPMVASNGILELIYEQITGTKDDNKEKKYIINFIGDNTHANLNKKDLAKFEKEYKTYSNTKKKDLLDSIKKAKELYETKEEKQNKITPTIEEKQMQSISLSPLKPLESNSSKKDDSSVSLLKRKTKRSSDSKGTSDLIQKIIAYISNVVKLISSKTIDKVLNDKECILKIMEYLKEYKMNEPIDFLKVSIQLTTYSEQIQGK